MIVSVEKSFPIAASLADAWKLMTDIPAVAACLPGAEVGTSTDSVTYTGKMRVKLGPVSAAFGGTIDVVSIDVERHALTLRAKGADTTGTSHATMDLLAGLTGNTDGTCTLTGKSDFNISGRIANLGARLIQQVSDQLLKRFAATFEARASGRAEMTSPQALDGVSLGLDVLRGIVSGRKA